LFVGKVIGRHKLSPLVSPNKTVEGAVGGVAAGVIAAYIFNIVAGFGMAMTTVIVLPLLIGVVGIIGDLIESVIKRSAGAKDSGALIPGHGGALDRIDSLLFAIPLLYYYLAWM
jgi:phosphatidate cytidylyltransferase